VIDRVPGVENAILATGHGMWGLQLAPLTGRMVAALAQEEAPPADMQPLRADRFRAPARASNGRLSAPRRQAAMSPRRIA